MLRLSAKLKFGLCVANEDRSASRPTLVALGTVENIGLKTTRLANLGGEQRVFSKADLLANRIRHYKRMRERRVVFPVGIEYSIRYEQLKKAPSTVKKIVETVPDARFDRSHVVSYDHFSSNFETVYYVSLPDDNLYADVQQENDLAIFTRFEDEGIIFAFPDRTLYQATDGKKSLQMHVLKEPRTGW
jgi:small-conductance mechanosensitive channel